MLKNHAIGLVREQIRKKLASAFGMNLTFDKFNFSLLGGTVEAEGVTISTGDASAPPLLTIRRIRAEVSLAAALKKEFVVKSLAIERPVINLFRDASGKLNLPTRPTPADTSATSDSAADKPVTEDAGGSWKLDAKKVLVVDAEVHYREAGGYHASLDRLLAEVKEIPGTGFELTLMADSVARRDTPVSVGQLKITGTASNVPSLMRWQGARLAGSFELGEMLRGKVEVPSLKPPDVKTEFQGKFDLDLIRQLLPSRKQ